jgi:starvation-inducible DNA-binding protein
MPRRPLARALSEALADTSRPVFKTPAAHWNVEGTLFLAVHAPTEAQSTEMFAAADAIAERIRAPGQLAPNRLDEVIRLSVVDEAGAMPPADAMVQAWRPITPPSPGA